LPKLPIGRPISNTRIYMLDHELQPVPIGVTGEIFIGGDGLAAGYLNRPDLTAERFVPDPFSGNLHGRLYKTGDLGRWRTDGNIEFLGRNDQQVKLRGFRIELGEIEAKVLQQNTVRDAAVLVREDLPGQKRLVAYVTRRGEGDLTVAQMRRNLKAVLPEYMVPSAFVILDNLPLTANGKIDRGALPAPDAGAYATRQYTPPQGEMEETLARIWQALLNVERIGQEDNFFELGGHSLLALKAADAMSRSSGATLTVADIYRSPTVRELAARIREGAAADDPVELSRESRLDDDIIALPGRRCVPAKNVMLTGGTGFVGRFLLAQLLEDTTATIYCLARAQSEQDAFSRLRATLLKWDLWRDGFEQRIVAVPGDLRLPHLGIDEVRYRLLCDSIDSIYHCATSMNHLETYEMAKPATVGAARELLRLATQGRPKLINHISTLGIFGSRGTAITRVVSELSCIDQEAHWHSRGYEASKWVGEKIFMTAADKGIPCNIFRLGLVWADARKGRYDELQHEYRLIKSCLLSGTGIKGYRYPLPATPVDYVARAIVSLATRHSEGHGIFHISSPKQPHEGIFERCNEITGKPLELLSFYEWVQEIKRYHQAGFSLPIVPLVEFAFSMDETSFDDYQRRSRSENLVIDCTRTCQELEELGITAPILDDDLLGKCLRTLFATDADLREMDRSEGNHHDQGTLSGYFSSAGPFGPARVTSRARNHDVRPGLGLGS
jgi:thioester reductase-like protein